MGLLKKPLGPGRRPPQAAEMEVSVQRSKEERVLFFFPQGASSCIPLSCHLGPFSRKISPEYSLDWGPRLTPASGCPLGVPVAWEVVVEVAGVASGGEASGRQWMVGGPR